MAKPVEGGVDVNELGELARAHHRHPFWWQCDEVVGIAVDTGNAKRTGRDVQRGATAPAPRMRREQLGFNWRRRSASMLPAALAVARKTRDVSPVQSALPARCNAYNLFIRST